MAQIIKRGDSFSIRVLVGTDENGKRILENITFKPTKKTEKARLKEAEEFARDFEKRVKEGKYLSGEKLTYREITDQWYSSWAAVHLADQGAEYLRLIKQYAYPAFGMMKISKIVPLHIQTIMDEMQSQGLKASSIRKTLAAMNSVFRYAYRMNIIQENPCARCELPKMVKGKELHFFTPEQVQTFFKALEMPYDGDYKKHTPVLHYKAFYALAIYGGLRRGEICALKWKDIDFENRTVNIEKAEAYRKGGNIVKTTKTMAGLRTVSLPSACIDILRQWQLEELKLCWSLGSAWKGNSDPDEMNIFIKRDGTMLDVTGVSKHFHKVILRWNESCIKNKKEQEMLPVIRLHDLRHTSATLLLGNGCDIATLSHRLGHSKVSVTLDVYSHPLPENERMAADILEKAIPMNA